MQLILWFLFETFSLTVLIFLLSFLGFELYTIRDILEFENTIAIGGLSSSNTTSILEPFLEAEVFIPLSIVTVFVLFSIVSIFLLCNRERAAALSTVISSFRRNTPNVTVNLDPNDIIRKKIQKELIKDKSLTTIEENTGNTLA